MVRSEKQAVQIEAREYANAVMMDRKSKLADRENVSICLSDEMCHTLQQNIFGDSGPWPWSGSLSFEPGAGSASRGNAKA